MFQPNLDLRNQVVALADGRRSLAEIAAQCGCHRNTVWRIAEELGLPTLPARHSPKRSVANGSWKGGRQIRTQGYAYVPAGDHPTTRADGYIPEHVMVAEQSLGRQLQRTEIVHHIDGLTLHNDPRNLEIMTRAEHTTHHLAGLRNKHSQVGLEALRQARLQPEALAPAHIRQMRAKRGDLRLRQCILIVSKFGLDSPFALGTTHWLEQSGIDPTSRPSLERAWADLMRRYDADLAR